MTIQMQISADEKLMHCRFVLHSRPVLRGVHGDDKKKKKKHNNYMAKHKDGDSLLLLLS